MLILGNEIIINNNKGISMKNFIYGLGCIFLIGCGGSGGESGEGSSPPATEKKYTVSASATDGGSITPPSQTVQSGETIVFTVTANDGYEIGTVEGCNGTLSGNLFTTGVITESCAVSASFSSLPSSDSLGPQKTLFALVGFSDQEKKISVEDVKDLIIDNPDSLNQFIIDNSNGKAWVDAEFMDWIDLEKKSTYYFNESERNNEEFHSDAVTAISQLTNMSEIDRLVIIGTRALDGTPGCYAYQQKVTLGNDNEYTGYFAVLGGGGNTDDDIGCITSGRIAHEYGHTFGFGHTFETACPIDYLPTSLLDRHYENACTNSGYWTMYDTMSYDLYNPLYSTVWRNNVNWLDEDQARTITEPGVYTLTQSSAPSAGVKLFKIPVGTGLEGKELFYYVEYRKKLGVFDVKEFEGSNEIYEVLVRHTDFAGGDFNKDNIGYSHGSSSINALDVGRDFIDRYRDISFSVLSVDDNQEASTVDIAISTPRAKVLPSYVFSFADKNELEKTFSLKNISGSTFEVTSVTISGRTADGLSILSENCTNIALPADGECSVTVNRVSESAIMAVVEVHINNGEIKQAIEFAGESIKEEVPYDPSVELEWQNLDKDYGENLNWQEAIQYCQNLSFNGHNDWRLPSIEELRAEFQLSNEPIYNVTIDLWSISEAPNNILNAYYISGNSSWFNNDKSQLYNALCVRNK